jgi:hypothetical protein
MHVSKIRCDGKSEKFCKIFGELNGASVVIYDFCGFPVYIFIYPTHRLKSGEHTRGPSTEIWYSVVIYDFCGFGLQP